MMQGMMYVARTKEDNKIKKAATSNLFALLKIVNFQTEIQNLILVDCCLSIILDFYAMISSAIAPPLRYCPCAIVVAVFS